MPSPSLDVSIIVPAHNEGSFLLGLLNSLEPIRHYVKDVIVVNNGSTDGTGEVAARFGCTIVENQTKLFPSVARNLGVAEASGSVLIFLDADVEVTQSWLDELPRLVASFSSRSNQITGDQYHVSKSPSWIERNWFAAMRHSPPCYINGGNLITSRTTFDAATGFDEELETGEDVDFCARAVASGAHLQLNRQMKVHHEGYPKTISGFLRRERWHGVGDFRNIRSVVQSSVAIATLLFMVLHAVLIASIAVTATQRSAAGIWLSAIGILGLCAASSLQKFRRAGLRTALKAAPVMYLYYVGRSLSAIDAIRKRFAGTPCGPYRSNSLC